MLETQAVTAPRAVVSTASRAERSFTISTAPTPSHLSVDSSPPSPSRKSADRLARSEARLMMAAGACTTIFCAILVIYLAAYARVTNLGLAQSHARVQLRGLSQENQILRAQLAQIQSPDRIAARAGALGMALGAPQVCYIPPSGDARANAVLPGGADARANAITPGVAARANANSDTADQTLSEPGHQTPRVASSGANSDDITSASLGH